MRLIFSLLLLGSVLGCRTKPSTSAVSKPFDYHNPLTTEQLQEAKERIHLLRENMTDEQIFTTLGLSNCYGRCPGFGGGPLSNYRMFYRLDDQHRLLIIRDVTSTARKILGASLDDTSWPNSGKY